MSCAELQASQLLCLGVGSAALVSIPAMTGNFKVYAADHHKSKGNFVKITEVSIVLSLYLTVSFCLSV